MPKTAQYIVIWSQKEDRYLLTESKSGASHLLSDEEYWQQWLAAHRSFAFHGRNGQINLLKEKRSRGEDDYWYAYQRHGKKMVKRYAGRSVQLNAERLEEISTLLAQWDEVKTGQPSENASPAF